ncbi:hypothetical protein L249_0057 [Ophiocordyceps polyrhachis-furcata BCC 54312]|uniref:Uncharacterized protein n=1 Tax=Ophiocordyceps polyrhachis-furcata BCC 54312 TaxID=1330021 RepID=A0A367LFB6_9HYPO|nr:hypothetical protein L249_0057 [Ophiocordyceps polyrhachis-furcata BCC 54312]
MFSSIRVFAFDFTRWLPLLCLALTWGGADGVAAITVAQGRVRSCLHTTVLEGKTTYLSQLCWFSCKERPGLAKQNRSHSDLARSSSPSPSLIEWKMPSFRFRTCSSMSFKGRNPHGPAADINLTRLPTIVFQIIIFTHNSLLARRHADHELRRRTRRCVYLFKAAMAQQTLADNDWLGDRTAEMKWWSYELNAEKRDRTCLDFRLRNRPDTRRFIAHLLDCLASLLMQMQYTFGTGEERCSEHAESDTDSIDSSESEASDEESQTTSSDTLDDEASEAKFYIETNLELLNEIATVILASDKAGTSEDEEQGRENAASTVETAGIRAVDSGNGDVLDPLSENMAELEAGRNGLAKCWKRILTTNDAVDCGISVDGAGLRGHRLGRLEALQSLTPKMMKRLVSFIHFELQRLFETESLGDVLNDRELKEAVLILSGLSLSLILDKLTMAPNHSNLWWKEWRLFNESRWQLQLPDHPIKRILDEQLATDKKTLVTHNPGRKPCQGPPTAPQTPDRAKMPPDTEWIVDEPVVREMGPRCAIPPVCDADLALLIDFAVRRGAKLEPELRSQVHAAVTAGRGPQAAELRGLCLAGEPPLKGDDDEGDTPDPRIFDSFGVLSPSAWAALDYSLSLMEIFCPRPSPEMSLLPVAAAVSITTFYDHVGTADGCVGEAKDYTAGIFAFLPYLPSDAPGPAGLDLLLDQLATTAFGRQLEVHDGQYDADVFMHGRIVDGAPMGFNAIFTAMGCSAVPCDELGRWNCSCPLAHAVLETYMITNDLVDFISDCVHAEPMNLYRSPLLAGAPLPAPVEHWLRLGPLILQCSCGMADADGIHSDLFLLWVGAMTYNMITPRCRFARTLAWHARMTAGSSGGESFPRHFRPYVQALVLETGASRACADGISRSPTPLVELAALCSSELGRALLLLFADCLENGPDDAVVAKRASSIYFGWRSVSWGPGGRRLRSYHESLKRDLILVACSAFAGRTFLALDAYVRRAESKLRKTACGVE